MLTTKTLHRLHLTIALFYSFSLVNTYAQDLDPRAYVKAPVNGTFLIAGYSYSHGGVLTDPTLPLEDLKATVNVTSLGIARTFSLFGQSAQA